MTKRFDRDDFIIRLEAQILGIDSIISRTLELPRDLNFAQLHEVLQAAFGWTDSHEHQFIVGGLVVGAPEYLEEDAYGPRVIAATEVHLRDLRFPYRPNAQLEILYQYDFSDNWQHRLILTPMLRAESVKYPRCIAGSRAGPPEDVGGDIRYQEFLEAWRDPEHEEDAANRRWAGRKFDPERFDLEAANRTNARALRLSCGDYRARQI